MQAVRELDEDDAHVLGHRHEEPLQVARLVVAVLVRGGRVDLRDLGDLRLALDDAPHRRAEAPLDVVEADRVGVLDGVVEQARDERLGVHAHLCQDARDLDGVRDKRLAALAPLARVRRDGELERLAHGRARGVAGEVPQQRAQAAPEVVDADRGRRDRLVHAAVVDVLEQPRRLLLLELLELLRCCCC